MNVLENLLDIASVKRQLLDAAGAVVVDAERKRLGRVLPAAPVACEQGRLFKFNTNAVDIDSVSVKKLSVPKKYVNSAGMRGWNTPVNVGERQDCTQR